MKLVSWNCQGGFDTKQKKIMSIAPDIAVIQDCLHPSKLQSAIDYSDAVWVGNKEDKGLCVLSFSKDYKLSMLVDEVKYEWVVPIKVSGDVDLVLLAVWARRMPGYSYGKLVFAALKEYEQFLSNGQVIIIGDFNVDKNVSSSYSGIKGSKGFGHLIELLESYGVTSCYHHFSKEEFGLESKANYHHYGKSDRPFHVHYCFASQEILQSVKQFYIGEGEEWAESGYHFPLVLEVAMNAVRDTTNLPQDKIDITPEMLKEKYNLIINNETTTSEEIEQAIRYIKALRIMKKEEYI